MTELYFGGTILTMEPGPAPGAVLTDGGRIVAVGDPEALRPRAEKCVDLAGGTLLPAFLDPHSHITAVASTLNLAQLGADTSFDQLCGTLQAFRDGRRLPAGAWVVGSGYDHNILAEGCHPTRQVLDGALPHNPCIIAHASGHMAVANSAALRAMGITADTPDPEGGKIGREADGKTPSGYLEESAFIRLAAGAIPQPGPEQALGALLAAQDLYLSQGYILAQDGMTGQSQFDLLKAGGEAGLTLDVVGYADMKAAPALADEPPVGGFSMGGYKIFLDGSPQGRTAWMLAPYRGEDPDYCGYPVYTDGEVTAFIRKAVGEKRQLLCHCNGDAAAEQYLRCYEKAGGGTVADDLRPVMIHAQLVRREQLARMGAIGMMPSFFAAHIWYWGDIHVKNFGPGRAAEISPLRWAADLGLPFTMHQDSPVIPPNALESVWCAVNRVTRQGAVLGPELKLSPLEALRAFTVNAAYQYHMEGDRGSIAPGKRADFVLLDADPTSVAPMEIRNIKVLETIKDGVSVYRAQDGGKARDTVGG